MASMTMQVASEVFGPFLEGDEHAGFAGCRAPV